MNTRPDSAEPCVLLPWDTEFWGFPVARLNPSAPDAAAMREALAWCSERGVRCLYLLADGGCPRTLALAHERGFRFVDIRVELTLPLAGPAWAAAASGGARVRPAVAADLPALRRLAAVSHHDTRFFKDDRFDACRAAELYGEWIARDLRRHTVFVCDAPSQTGEPCGYVSCERDGEAAEGRIGLIAVAAAHKGAGLGTALLAAAIGWFSDAQATSARVVTQGTNVAALRLYERCGFRTSGVNVWFHKWF
jgi:dTDP-4-amino-4,6-dideoxy-D-galactose acyltransferase